MMAQYDSYINNHSILRTDLYVRLESMSDLLVHLTSSHMSSLSASLNENSAVFLVGSVGRGEFILGKSDLDFVFVNLDNDDVDRIMWSIQQNARPLLRLDPNDVKEKIVDGKILPDCRRYFPAIKESTLFDISYESAKRRVQLLFEGRQVWGKTGGTTIQEKCIKHYELLSSPRTGVPMLLDDIEKLEIEIQKTATTYFGWKTKKYLGLRIPQELGRRLVLVAAIYHKSARQYETNQSSVYSQLLRRRTVNAILFWESHFLTGARFKQYKNSLRLKSKKQSDDPEKKIKAMVHAAVNSHTRLLDIYSRSVMNVVPGTLSDSDVREISGTLELFLDSNLDLLCCLKDIFAHLEGDSVFDFRNSSLCLSMDAAIRYIGLRKNQTVRWFSVEPLI